MSAEDPTDAAPRRGGVLRGSLLTLLLALVLALWILVSQDHWAFRIDLLPFTIGWVLDPGSGLIPLTLALWLVVEVPRRLLRATRGAGGRGVPGTAEVRAGSRDGAGAEAGPDVGTPGVRGTDAFAGTRATAPREATVEATGEVTGEAPDEARPRLRIPGGTFRELGAQHRWEMAEALGIPWRDEFLHDHQAWAVACLEAAQRRAADPIV